MSDRRRGWWGRLVRRGVLATVLMMVTASCAATSDTTLPEPSTTAVSADLLVVVSTPLLADVLTNLIGPDVGRIESLVERDEDPRTAELTAKDLQLLDQADLIVAIGSGFELFSGILDAEDGAENSTAPVLRLGTELVDEDGDPIIWTDPDLMAKGVMLIAQKLAEIDIRLATDEAADHADEYADSLRELDRTIADRFAPLREEQRDLATGQDVLGHLAERYELDVVAHVFDTDAPLDVLDVQNRIAESNAAVLVVDEAFPAVPDPAPFAESFGLRPIALPILTLGPPSSDTGTYIGALDALTRNLAEALATE